MEKKQKLIQAMNSNEYTKGKFKRERIEQHLKEKHIENLWRGCICPVWQHALC